MQWKHFPRYWPFVRGIIRSPANSPHKGQSRRALMFSLIFARTNGWVSYRDTGDMRRNRPQYDVTVLSSTTCTNMWFWYVNCTLNNGAADDLQNKFVLFDKLLLLNTLYFDSEWHVCFIIFIQAQIKENIKAPRHRPLWGNSPAWGGGGDSPGTSEFPAQMASNAENVFIWWRHHEVVLLSRHNHSMCGANYYWQNV